MKAVQVGSYLVAKLSFTSNIPPPSEEDKHYLQEQQQGPCLGKGRVTIKSRKAKVRYSKESRAEAAGDASYRRLCCQEDFHS